MDSVSPAFTSMSAFPPSFAGQPLTYMWAVFGLMVLQLLALQWAWRIGLAMASEKGRRLRDPITINRLTVLLLLAAPVMGGGPDLLYLMLWPEWTPATREAAAMLDRQLDGFVWVPFSAAWLLHRLAGPMIDWQLVREPLPINLWPTWQQMVQPMKIAGGALVLAFIVTFLR